MIKKQDEKQDGDDDFSLAELSDKEMKVTPFSDITPPRVKVDRKEPTTFVKLIDSDESDEDIRLKELKL